MDVPEFALAATTNSLADEPAVRDAADLVEFRMDKAADPIEQLSRYEGELHLIVTNRATEFGGDADECGRIDTLVAASKHDAVEFVDVELETARSDARIPAELSHEDVSVVVSHHDFDATPGRETLDGIIEECAEHGDVAKVATFPRETSDVLTLLGAVSDATERGMDVAGISMGALGSHTRVVGHLYGSVLGYAPLESDETEYAPGQIPVHTLASLIERIDDWSTGTEA